MIVYIILFLVVTTILSWTLIEDRKLGNIIGILSTLLLLGSVALVIMNFAQHWGMKQETNISTAQVFSASSSNSAGVLIADRMGTGSNHYVMVYRSSDTVKKATAHFVPDKNSPVETVKKSATYKCKNVSKATITTKKKQWVWKNNFYKDLLDVGEQNNELINQKNIVTVPQKTWVVLTSNQAKKLNTSKQGQSNIQREQQQKALQSVLSSDVASYQKNHPNASKKEISNYEVKKSQEISVQSIKRELK